MATIDGPARRSGDARRPQPRPFGPMPGTIGPADPAGVMRSITFALESARRLRRPMTLVSLEIPAPGDEHILADVADLVRRTVRESDGVWRDGECSLVLLLTDADGPSSEPALARIRLRLKSRGLVDVTMGRAAPPPGLPAEELLLLARQEARPIA
jgi:hypothetical protein